MNMDILPPYCQFLTDTTWRRPDLLARLPGAPRHPVLPLEHTVVS